MKEVGGGDGGEHPDIVWFHLYEVSSIGKSKKTETRLMVDRSWREGRMGNGYDWVGVSFGGRKKNIHELYDDDGSTTLWIY